MRGGNRRPQTFRDCEWCGKRFGPLDRLARRFCSIKCSRAYIATQPSGKKGKHYPHLQRAEERVCKECGETFRGVKDTFRKKQKFCSKACFQKYWIHSVRKTLKPKGLKGEKNPSWTGDDYLYSAIHQRVEKKYGTPRECEHCGSTTKRRYEWANIDHAYASDARDQWMRLCTSCHRKHDIAQGIQGDAMPFRSKKRHERAHSAECRTTVR